MAAIVAVLKLVSRSGNSRAGRIRAIARDKIITHYPDKRLEYDPEGAPPVRSEYFALFNRGMLRSADIHCTKVRFDYFQTTGGPHRVVLDETTGHKKDFAVYSGDDSDTLFTIGEGTVDWSSWILRRSVVDRIVVYLGAMTYYGVADGLVAAATLVLVQINEDQYKLLSPRYVADSRFRAECEAIYGLLDDKEHRLFVDFQSLIRANPFYIRRDTAASIALR